MAGHGYFRYTLAGAAEQARCVFMKTIALLAAAFGRGTGCAGCDYFMK